MQAHRSSSGRHGGGRLPAGHRRIAFRVAELITVAFSFACWCRCSPPEPPAPAGGGSPARAGDATEPKPGSRPEAKTGIQILAGRWLRPDGGYVIEVRRIEDDGRVEAAYFNPRPIHVERASAADRDGTISLFVELRDVHYPGCTYKLTYDRSGDRLTGEYYQAMMRQRYEVAFDRQK
jgi:hypothetical protein